MDSTCYMSRHGDAMASSRASLCTSHFVPYPKGASEKGTGMSNYLVAELARYVQQKQAILIAGAGVTMSATQDSTSYSWQGLLRSGLRRCTELRTTDPAWLESVRRKIESKDATTLIEGAQEIQKFLESRPGGHFGKWLRDVVGSAPVKKPGLLSAIAELGIPVATTNYDSLLSDALGGLPVTWEDPAGIQRVVRREEPGVIHIHGHWKRPESVVLGVASYEKAMGDKKSQEIVRSLFASHSVIFAGFGSGLDDPNFTGLREWARDVLSRSDYPPTILVRTSEVAAVEERYGGDKFQVVPYGDSHDDLELFLASLRPRPASSAQAKVYDWPTVQTKLGRLNRRIQSWNPDLVIAMSGPGNFAPSYCMTLDTNETPTLNAVTFPKTRGRSKRNLWFQEIALATGWKHFESTKWDVFVPSIVASLPRPSRVLIFDDRVIGGNVQRRVAAWLRDELGHDVRRAALVVHPAAKHSVDWYEDEIEGEFSFPWGNQHGRS